MYEDLSRDFAMSIGGEMSIDRIGRSSFEALAAECAMSSKLILSRLDGLAGRIVGAAKRIAAQAEKDWPSPIYERIVDTIASQVAHVKRNHGLHRLHRLRALLAMENVENMKKA